MHKFLVTLVTHGHRSESIFDQWYWSRFLTPRGQSSKITKSKISQNLLEINPKFVLHTLGCDLLFGTMTFGFGWPWRVNFKIKIKPSLKMNSSSLVNFRNDNVSSSQLKKTSTRQKLLSWPWPFVTLEHLLLSMSQNMQIHWNKAIDWLVTISSLLTV